MADPALRVDPGAARIVDLGKRREQRAAAAVGLVPVLDEDLVDLEAVLVEEDRFDVPVDPPDQPRTVPAMLADLAGQPRQPIVPAWLRDAEQRLAVARLSLDYGVWLATKHATMTPWYLAKTCWYAPKGAVRTVWRLVMWARAEEGNWELRQEAATRNQHDVWLKLDARRMQQARWRWTVLGGGSLVGVAAAGFGASPVCPGWASYAAAAAAIAGCARLGRPLDKPIITRVWKRPRYRKLTAELVRKGLMATGKIKAPEDVMFEREIVRDGPGYLAVAELPDGVVSVDIVDKRDQVAGALRLPVDQVWPEIMPREHPGRVALWVADRPVSAMRQPKWPLLREGTTDYFAPFPYGFDPRMRTVDYRMDERNSLFAGVPGSGKSLSARVPMAAMALDPLVTFAVFDLAGRGDFDMFEPLCPPKLFGSGADDATIRAAYQMILWLLRECDTRGPLIKKYAKAGMNSENKLNRAIAQRDPRLRMIVALIDEIQELINDDELGKAARKALTSVVKRGRALGIHLVLATQRIDAESLPKGVTSNIAIRSCLAVPSHTEVELALGTGMYKKGARPNAFEIGVDSGWSVRVGYGPMTSVRAAYLDRAAVERICSRGVAMRGGPLGEVDLPPARDILVDLVATFGEREPGQHWETLAGRLAERWPEAYQTMTAEALSAMVRALDVPSVDVKVRGAKTARKGCRLAAIIEAIADRDADDEPDDIEATE